MNTNIHDNRICLISMKSEMLCMVMQSMFLMRSNKVSKKNDNCVLETDN